MPAGWTPRATAPGAADLWEEFKTLVGGGTDAWLAEFGWLVAGALNSYQMPAICAAFPIDPPILTIDDLVPAAGAALGGPTAVIAGASALIMSREKIMAYALWRVGSAHCELAVTTPVGTWSPQSCVTVTSPTGTWGQAYEIALPAGATSIEISWERLPGGQSGFAQAMSNVRSYVDGDAQSALETLDYSRPTTGTSVHDITNRGWLRFQQYNEYNIRWCWRLMGGAVDIVQTSTNPVVPEAPPLGFIGPVQQPEATLTQVRDEVFQIEKKLDMVRDLLLSAVAPTVPSAVASPAALPITAAPVGVFGARAIIVSLDAVPDWADEAFGIPPKLHRIGRVTFGGQSAYCDPTMLSENPMLIPVPNDAEQVWCTIAQGLTGTIRVIF